MIPSIAKALSKGFTANQVVKYIIRQFPNHKDSIEKALTAGFTADQIIRHFSRNSGQKLENPTTPQINTEYSQTRDVDIARRNKEEKIGAGIASAPFAAQAGLSALSRLSTGGQGAAMAMQHAMPQNPTVLPGNTQQKLLPTATQQPPINPQNPPAPSTPQAPNQPQAPIAPSGQAQSMPQSQQSLQPIQLQRDVNKSVDIIKTTGQEATIKNLIEGGLSPTEIKDTLSVILGKKKLKELDAAVGGIEQAIEDYASTMQKAQLDTNMDQVQDATNMLQEEPKKLIPRENISQIEEIEPKNEEIEEVEFQPIQKNSIVASEQGIGTVKEIRNGKAIVEIDGKKHQVNEEDLIESPISTNDLADLHDDLIKGIEKSTGKEISKNVEWAGYDPKLNELAYKPWQGGGKIYSYTDISPEDIEELQSILAQRKTSGENYIGAWEKDTKSPIGNRMHALITKLQKERGGKGNEYRSKFETIYDPLEPAKKASQERYKNERKLQKTGQQQPKSSENTSHSKPNEIKKEKIEPELKKNKLENLYDKLDELRLEKQKKENTYNYFNSGGAHQIGKSRAHDIAKAKKEYLKADEAYNKLAKKIDEFNSL